MALALSLLLAATATGCGLGEDTESPTPPAGVTAQAGSATSVHVMWEWASDNEEVTGYEVVHEGRPVASVPGTKRMVDVNSLDPSTRYVFTVRARDAAGNISAPSAPVPVTTPDPTPDDREAPTAPARLRGAVDGSRAVTLAWQPAADDMGVTAYDVYQEDTRIHSVGGSETGARIANLRPGTVYTFTVRARDAAENSSPDSDPVDLTTAPAPGDDTPNTAPTDLKVAARPDSVTVTWTPPKADGPVREHQLYLNGEPVTTIVWGAEPPAGRAAYTFTVTDPPGTRFSVKLRARLPDGKWGDLSAQRTAVIPNKQ
ncbi:fibronectin type III domain-containing protein [Streptomyces sp. MUM 178J]|nr:fibronectin type III domain-containing protein [Streptomyces sp. MUM 178J]WRQ83385.1 fibronectin type III domain-containing protein [Streptomyces sp. MUM 178J]